jgi:CAAX protease family protein
MSEAPKGAERSSDDFGPDQAAVCAPGATGPSKDGVGAVASWIVRHPLLAFFACAFALAWLVWVPIICSSRGWLPFPIPRDMALIGAWAPTASSILLTGMAGGKAGLRSLFAGLGRWKVGVQWYAFALFGPGIITLAALGLHRLLGGSIPETVHLTPWYAPLLTFATCFPLFLILGGPLAEELGWRGYALPRLLARRGRLAAALLLGLLWGVWHLPLFWIPDGGSGQGPTDFFLFLLEITAWSVLWTWVYINTRGSVLLCVLLHAAANTTLSAALPILPVEAGQVRPFALMIALTWAAALIALPPWADRASPRSPTAPQQSDG